MASKKPSDTKTLHRAPNFNSKEDAVLCRAYVNVSEDPIKGTDQKASQLWTNVKQVFDKILDDELTEEEAKELPERTPTNLQICFNQHIAVGVRDFKTYYRRAHDNLGSGQSPVDVLKQAVENYLEFEGRPFKFPQCVEILHKMPTFRPVPQKCDELEHVAGPVSNSPGDDEIGPGISAETEDSSDDTTPDSKPKAKTIPKKKTVGATTGSGSYNSAAFSGGGAKDLKRPIGRNLAKKIRAEENEHARDKKKKMQIMESMADGTQKLAMAIASKSRREHLVEMVKLQKEIGDMDEMKRYLMKLKEVDKKDIFMTESKEAETKEAEEAETNEAKKNTQADSSTSDAIEIDVNNDSVDDDPFESTVITDPDETEIEMTAV